MKTIEFQADIRDGMIQIPEQYWREFAEGRVASVQVRVLVVEPEPPATVNLASRIEQRFAEWGDFELPDIPHVASSHP
ncbi:MAG: hypothetical protein HC910_12450 [Spirulinaceae cyanobacterium SM2_1_0]|nr:hypothetical protein [Spirulinaceae cyanobacterium SM2_1_0]